MLDDGVIGRPPINQCDSIQRDTDADEVEDFVDESTGSEKSNLSTPPIANISGQLCSHSGHDECASLKEKDGKRRYPQDMITAPSSSANFIVLYPRPEPLP